MRRSAVAALVALAMLASAPLFGLDATLQSVEIDVVLHTDGKADVFYSTAWSASGGQMHGFYFEGFGPARPVYNMERCYADLGSGERVPLEIKDLGGGR